MLPPRDSLGWFTQPGDCEGVAAWLVESGAERVVVSIEMLCFGGLVASRSPEVGPDGAIRRLEALRELRRERPEAAVFAFSVITRLGRTVASAGEAATHRLLRAYSELVDRVERLGERDLRGELDALVERLDASVLGGYLEVRRRNHAVNRAAIQMAAEGVIDYLALAQEDAAEVGIHIPEQRALRDQVEEFRVADRVAIHPGADEVGMVLAARHCLAELGRPVRICADYASEGGAQAVPRFESQALWETVEGQMEAAGARPAPPGEADAMMFVHTPVGEQGDIAEGPEAGGAPALAMQAESVCERIRGAAAAGCIVGLADAAYCNGADRELIAALGRTGAGRCLSSFAGWNTSANTIGTVVSQLCLAAGGDDGRGRPEAESGFLAARFIDDYGYQSVVRGRALARAAELGADPYALGDAWPEMEHYVAEELSPLAHEIHSDLLAGPGDDALGEVQASLPWRRLFEVEVGLTR